MKRIMENKKGFKKTKLELIPEDWKVYKLGDLGDFKNGINKGKDDFGFGVPFINLMDVFGKPVLKMDNWQLVNASKTEIENYSLEKGDVLFIRSSVKPSGVGLTSVIKEDVENTVYSGFLIRFRPNTMKVFNIDYLQYCFFENNFRKSLIVRSSTSANTNVNQENLQELKIILPPLPEQQKIATILSKWDELIETQTQLIEEKEKQQKGLMQKLLTGEVRFPGFEEEWEEVELGDDCKTFSGGTPRRNRKEYYNGKIPWIKSGELNSPNIYSTEESITELGLKNSSAKLVPANTVLLAMYGATAGVISITRIEATVNQAILVIQPSENLDYLFLYYYLKFIMPFELQRLIQGGQPNLSADVVKSIKLAMPSISEQNKITSFLLKCDEEIQSLKDKLEAIKLQKKGLMQQLLTGKIRVKI